MLRNQKDYDFSGDDSLRVVIMQKVVDKAEKSPKKTEESEGKTFDNRTEDKKKGGRADPSELYTDEPVEVQCIHLYNKGRLENPEKETDIQERRCTQ